MKRLFDLLLVLPACVVLLPLFAILALWVRLESPGPALYWSKRIGRGGAVFLMPKFRSMRTDTPVVATHLLSDPDRYLTRAGRALRRTSLDELPQLFCVLWGDMSLVGPRPALFNQYDLIALRASQGIDALRPGITGWAQVNGRDELPIPDKVALDVEYLRRQSFVFDLRILVMTVHRVLMAHGVSH